MVGIYRWLVVFEGIWTEKLDWRAVFRWDYVVCRTWKRFSLTRWRWVLSVQQGWILLFQWFNFISVVWIRILQQIAVRIRLMKGFKLVFLRLISRPLTRPRIKHLTSLLSCLFNVLRLLLSISLVHLILWIIENLDLVVDVYHYIAIVLSTILDTGVLVVVLVLLRLRRLLFWRKCFIRFVFWQHLCSILNWGNYSWFFWLDLCCRLLLLWLRFHIKAIRKEF